MEYLQLFWMFFKIGAFTIGGGYAMIPLINSEVVSVFPQMYEPMQDLIGISQVTPGPFAVNAATFTGMTVAGVGGAVAATFGLLAPSYIITTLIARFFLSVKDRALVKNTFYGMRPAVVGLILGTVIMMLPEQWNDDGNLNLKMMLITITAVFGMLKLKINPIVVVLFSGVAGLILFGLL